MDKLNKLNNIESINENKYNELNNKYNNFKENLSMIFKKLISKINEIQNIFENNFINNIYDLNYNNPKEISNFIFEAIENIENQIKIKLDKKNEHKIVAKFKEKEDNKIDNNFSIFNNFNDEFIQQKNTIKSEIKNEFNNNGGNKLIKPINEIKNGIDCIYVPNYCEENEINLIHDYQFINLIQMKFLLILSTL